MDFGLFNLMGYRTDGATTREILLDTVEKTKIADQGGMGISWFAEHHFSNYGVCGSPLLMAATCAPQTRKIKLASGILVMPLYSPVRVAEEIAMVDSLCEGRLIVGVGTGYQPFEFDRFGVDLGESKLLFEEYMEVIEQGLTEEFVELQGKYVSLPRTHIGARPHRGKPPIWVAGHSPEVHRWAAKRNYPMIVIGRFEPSGRVAAQRPYFEQLLTDAGHDATALQWGLLRHCCVTESKQEALEFAENARWQLRVASSLRRRKEVQVGHVIMGDEPMPNEATVDDILATQMIGGVEHCIERGVEEIRKTGACHIALFFQIGDFSFAKSTRSLELFITKVIPGIEKECGSLAELNIGGTRTPSGVVAPARRSAG
jgi:alkanesulfonate monooxygenase SsuD/methylene tetrahydromethanopterin reductase-like flavin-dependent oxidoreductase (luciferase family)